MCVLDLGGLFWNTMGSAEEPGIISSGEKPGVMGNNKYMGEARHNGEKRTKYQNMSAVESCELPLKSVVCGKVTS